MSCKYLVVGYGNMGAKTFSKFRECGVNMADVVLVDINKVARNTALKDFPGITVVDRVEKAFKFKPEQAFIFVNAVFHFEVVVACVQAGIKKIFVEKPFVDKVAEVEILSELLEEAGDITLVVGHLINFPEIVNWLLAFARKKGLVPFEIIYYWVQSWLARTTPMGPDHLEKPEHPLGVAAVLAEALLGSVFITDTEMIGSRSCQHMNPGALEIAMKSGVVKSVEPTGSTSLALVHFVGEQDSFPLIGLSSFVDPTQKRRMVVQLGKSGDNSRTPTYTAVMEFDNGKHPRIEDCLTIYNALEDNAIEMEFVSVNDKIKSQIKAVLALFEHGTSDPRLVSWQLASQFVRACKGTRLV